MVTGTMRLRGLAVAVTLAAGVSACGGKVKMASDRGPALPSLTGVSQEQWAALANRRIFFGHQSVGRNIMDGVAAVLAANPDIRVAVVESKELDSTAAPGFYHAKVGRNLYPLEKADEFVRVAERAFPADGIAMLKFCYVDIEPGTDARAVFEEYRQRMEALRRAHPGLTIVHFTMPLTLSENWKGYWMNRLRGIPSERDRNAVRNRYNAVLRAAYEGKEPIFDIALLESTAPDGSRPFFERGADTVHVMVPQYTDDGGHLNTVARRMVAEQLLIMLARLQPAAPAARGPS